MKTTIRLTLFFLISFLLSCNSEDEKVLKLTGKVIGAETDTIVLIKINQDTRFDSLIKIPVNNGSFTYNQKLKEPEAVHLAFAELVKRGAFRPMPVFLENQEINLTIYPEEEFDRNIVEGGELNTEYKNFKKDFETKFNSQIVPVQDSLRLLFKSNNYYSEKAKELYEELRNSKNQDEKIPVYKKIEDLANKDHHLSPEAKKLENRLKPILANQQQFQQSYIEENPSLVSYYFFLRNLIYDKENIDLKLAKRNYQILSKANEPSLQRIIF
ncbi:DUF4369 domain-containing protein [Gramella sp. AN32]|uniref:DUF4369 domain-containing protein n=1 Tax=Christiangramia antarctica TaxID=2058158 RepID=A0ABW5X1T2_9FLAO|nr:DUF4369 domain-containing protein [Gramella sp. AN32]MCM4156940.1 hypothetical protein [Gramella sp. AN32]